MIIVYDDNKPNNGVFRSTQFFKNCVTGAEEVYADNEKISKAYKAKGVKVFTLKEYKPKKEK